MARIGPVDASEPPAVQEVDAPSKRFASWASCSFTSPPCLAGQAAPLQPKRRRGCAYKPDQGHRGDAGCEFPGRDQSDGEATLTLFNDRSRGVDCRPTLGYEAHRDEIMTTAPAAPGALLKLGFSETEAETYCQLLRTPGATGYGFAQAIKKSQANVYSALSSLTAKGAVAVDQGSVRAYRAVPPAELLPRLSREYAASCAAAERALASLGQSGQGAGVYQVKH